MTRTTDHRRGRDGAARCGDGGAPCAAAGGFTLIELLVTIGILALLIALLLPAVQNARETARINQCKGNVRQIALGCLNHAEVNGYLPSLGTNYKYTCNPDQGACKGQQGGWPCSLLPYIEQMPLFQLGAGTTGAARTAANAQRALTIVPLLVCPNRGSGLNKFVPTTNYTTNRWTGTLFFARSDYAASQAMGLYPSQVTDGIANVFLCGERYLEPSQYSEPTVNLDCNQDGWTDGNNVETVSTTPYELQMETPGIATCGIFGGPHNVHVMAMCDGGVRSISYTIDPVVFNYLGVVNNGLGTVEDFQ